jgi:hypothetical protein
MPLEGLVLLVALFLPVVLEDRLHLLDLQVPEFLVLLVTLVGLVHPVDQLVLGPISSCGP